MPFQSSFSLPPLGNRGELDVILFLRNKTCLFLRVKALWADSKTSSSIEWSFPSAQWGLWHDTAAVTCAGVDFVGVDAIYDFVAYK